MKRFILVLILFLGLIGCNLDRNNNGNNGGNGDDNGNGNGNEQVDEIAPLFVNASNNELPKIRHKVGEEVDLLQNITVIDDVSEEVELAISNDGGYDNQNPGRYLITIEAKDEAGNTSYATRVIEVYYLTTVKYDALVINDAGIEYELNNSLAFESVSGSPRFRNTDIIQVMTKDFFLSELDRVKSSYNDNGGIPYLSSGVVVLLDSNMKVIQMRLAPNIEVDKDGNAVLATNWTNSKTSTGGGNFKGIVDVINSLNASYVVFAPNHGSNKAKNFLIQNLYYSEFDGTNLSIFNKDINLKNVNIKFEDDYEETIEMVEGEIIGSIIKSTMIYDGIPITTYYKNDKKPKKLLYFFHGFAGDRETGIMGRGETLAEMGFFVVAIDAYLHGERQPEFFKNLSYAEKQKEIVNIVMQTAKDAKHLYHKYFKHLEILDSTNIYAYGVSMGAAVTFYLATIMEELTTFASIVGSPSFVEFYEYKQQQYGWIKDEYYYTNLESYKAVDPLLNYELLKDKNIYMGVGTQDTTVPLKYAKALKEKLPNSNIVYSEYNVAHTSTPDMLLESYNFIKNN